MEIPPVEKNLPEDLRTLFESRTFPFQPGASFKAERGN